MNKNRVLCKRNLKAYLHLTKMNLVVMKIKMLANN